MEEDTPNNLPSHVVATIKEHSECFVLIHFNSDGFPIINIHAPSIKDFLALERLVMAYGANGLPLPDNIENIDEDENEDGESWKNN